MCLILPFRLQRKVDPLPLAVLHTENRCISFYISLWLWITAGFDVRQDAPGTTALRSVGLSVKDKGGKKLGPTSQYANNPRSGTEMMEGIVNTLKQAYYPGQINVATWDADLKLDTMKCCGLTEYGTAKSANGLEYRFAVFRGVGQMHWTGERDGWLASFSVLAPLL